MWLSATTNYSLVYASNIIMVNNMPTTNTYIYVRNDQVKNLPEPNSC